MDYNLTGEIAIVTGAGMNIGRAIAERLADASATIAIVDKDADRAEGTAATIRKSGGAATPIVADVTDEAQVQEMVQTVVAEHGRIDILVNNAAVMDRADFFDLTPAEFDSVVDVILRGTFLCTQKVSRVMKNDGGGRIVNLGSTSAHKGRPDAVAYATAKSGVLNLTRSAAKALAPYDIRVNTLSPTRTGSRTLGPEPESSSSPESVVSDSELRSRIPLGRLGRPKDHANAVMYLVSPAAEFVTGTELVVDGGSLC